MTPFRLAEIGLATWYLAYVLTSVEGPGGIFLWIREHVWHGRTKKIWPMASEGEDIRTTFHNGLLDCIICSAPWIALALWLVPDGVGVWALAAAGAALLAHGYAGWRYTQ